MKPSRPLIIAVDFDGTLCNPCYPEIGKAHSEIIELLKRIKADGHRLILWTCRDGAPLYAAIAWCKEHGLEFDAHNENVEECKWMTGPKVYADIYLDDRACHATQFDLLAMVVGR